MRKDNRIIVDLNKVQWMRFYYVNQYGQTNNTIINFPTIRSSAIYPEQLAAHHPLYPGEAELERAKRLDLLDVWTPVCVLKLTANECLQYTGDKAIAMRDAWQAKIFGKKNEN